MEIVIENKAQFDTEVAAGRVLVDFFATWCGPCKMLAPIIAQIAEEHPEVKVLKVDVDEVPEAAQQFGISAIPTLIYFEDGKKVDSNVGFAPKPSILRMIKA